MPGFVKLRYSAEAPAHYRGGSEATDSGELTLPCEDVRLLDGPWLVFSFARYRLTAESLALAQQVLARQYGPEFVPAEAKSPPAAGYPAVDHELARLNRSALPAGWALQMPKFDQSCGRWRCRLTSVRHRIAITGVGSSLQTAFDRAVAETAKVFIPKQ